MYDEDSGEPPAKGLTAGPDHAGDNDHEQDAPNQQAADGRFHAEGAYRLMRDEHVRATDQRAEVEDEALAGPPRQAADWQDPFHVDRHRQTPDR
ncbi:hypothetical protein [Micromonospora thermarum]|uniref:Uncharacterized protein n=1 Tax=Micromonospora thermarum TaxID=2720024 RepID=A0ABX0Z8S8_9ACTN|nr:hypothetical protein [Micromonospora thermarum]NJP34270.1 hypothetical protein [Micromonospora thermarum]